MSGLEITHINLSVNNQGCFSLFLSSFQRVLSSKHRFLLQISDSLVSRVGGGISPLQSRGQLTANPATALALKMTGLTAPA
jgi:hypothetical protein